MAQFDALVSHARQQSQRASLQGRLCIVGGGSGTVGSGIIRHLLREGATVVAPLRRQEQMEHLRHECAGTPLENLFPVIVNISDEGACGQLVNDLVDRFGPPDHAVSCFGSCCSELGMLTHQSLGEFYRVLADCAASHFVFAKHVLPAMKHVPSSSFLFVTSGEGERCSNPEASLYTVANGALFGIILAAQAQFAEHPFRINEMRVYALIKRHSELGGTNFRDFFGRKASSNRKVGKLAADALASSGHRERFSVTQERLDGEALTV